MAFNLFLKPALANLFIGRKQSGGSGSAKMCSILLCAHQKIHSLSLCVPACLLAAPQQSEPSEFPPHATGQRSSHYSSGQARPGQSSSGQSRPGGMPCEKCDRHDNWQQFARAERNACLQHAGSKQRHTSSTHTYTHTPHLNTQVIGYKIAIITITIQYAHNRCSCCLMPQTLQVQTKKKRKGE